MERRVIKHLPPLVTTVCPVNNAASTPRAAEGLIFPYRKGVVSRLLRWHRWSVPWI